MVRQRVEGELGGGGLDRGLRVSWGWRLRRRVEDELGGGG